MNRIALVVAVIIISLSTLGFITHPQDASIKKNPYEPAYHGECTWYAAEMRPDLRFNSRNANTWKSTSEANSYIVDKTPEVGAIAMWDANQGPSGEKAGSVGHLAYVTKVTDSTHFHVDEYNFPSSTKYHQFNDRDINVLGGVWFIHTKDYKTPLSTDNNTGSTTETVQSLSLTFESTLPLRNILIKTSSRIELSIDGKLVKANDRPQNWTVIPVDRVWIGYSRQHTVTIKWWQRGSETAPEFVQTWWPNRFVSAAEPGVDDELQISYTTIVQSKNLVAGQPVEITAAAMSPLGFPVTGIDMFVNGAEVSHISGQSGIFTWDTNNLHQGTYSLVAKASVDGWYGNIASRTISITLNGDQKTSGSSIGQTLNAPALSDPSNGSNWPQIKDITLSWTPSLDAANYKVELWGGPYSTMTSCDWQSKISCHIGQMRPGNMSWHVKARNSNGQESDWSDIWSFTIQDSGTPSVPSTSTPVDTALSSGTLSAPNLSNPSNADSFSQSMDITLSWNPSSNARQYKVELWGGPYSTMTPCDWQKKTSCHIGQMWPGTMSWHIKARNSSGQESDWSPTWSFTIQQSLPNETETSVPPSGSLGMPTLSRPANGDTYSQSADITLSWNTAPDATQYKVELWGGPYSTMIPCDWQNSTTCHIGQMWPGTMSWHVKARNPSGQESDWSPTWIFIINPIETQAPPPPILPSDTPAPQPAYVQLVDDLSLRTESGNWPPQAGEKIIAHIKIRNGGDLLLHIEHLGVRGRRNGSEFWDIGFWTADLNGHQEWSLDPNNEQPLVPGNYSFRISYSLDGSNWTEIGNEINFTVP